MLRETEGEAEILVFRHPLAGIQIVEGGVEPRETLEDAAKRELLEESGLIAQATHSLGELDLKSAGHQRHFFLCQSENVSDSWTHKTEDGGGLDFAFFWHRLARSPSPEWHENFREALVFVRQSLAETRSFDLLHRSSDAI